MKKSNIALIALVALAAGFFLWALLGSRAEPAAPAQNAPQEQAEVAPAAAYEAQSNSDGGIEVEVQPLDLTSSEWSFGVGLTTHEGSLDEDLAKIVSLTDDRGDAVSPLRWEGPSPGGHHRNGTLIFPQISPKPASITVIVRDVGGVSERKFTWQL